MNGLSLRKMSKKGYFKMFFDLPKSKKTARLLDQNADYKQFSHPDVSDRLVHDKKD